MIGQPTRNQALEILATAQRSGINKVDTAIAYGSAHELIGEYCRTNPPLDVYTKFKISDLEGNRVSLFLDSLCNSLSVDKIAGLAFHAFSDLRSCPTNVLLELKSSLRVKLIGVSVYEEDELKSVLESELIDYVQVPFNVLDSSNSKRELLALAQSKSVMVQARSVYLQGLLLKPPSKFPRQLAPLKKPVKEFQMLAKLMGRSVEELALRYVLDQDFIDEVAVGVESLAQLEQNIFHCNSPPLSENEKKELRAIDVANKELLNPGSWKSER